MFKIGCARTDITVYEPGMGMLGWAHRHNVVEGVAMPLHARAFVLEDADGGRAAIVVAEICFVTQALRLAIVEALERRPELGLTDERIMLTGTHTHSSPSGFSHTVFYNASTPGFSAKVYEGLTQGIVAAVEQAAASLTPGRVHHQAGVIPRSEPVAFNRVMDAYTANTDVATRAQTPHSPTALDRDMTVLRFDDEAGRPLGLISWFGVHGTSIHRDNRLLHPDNKGMASAWFERYAAHELDAPGFVAAFAQAPCCDVTPNRNFCSRRGMTIGEHEDDFESARINGEIQARFARRLFEACGDGGGLEPRLDAALLAADFSDLEVTPAYADGQRGRRTASAIVGLRMIFGTREGPGLPYLFAPAVEGATRARARLLGWIRGPATDTQTPKMPLLELGRGMKGKALGFFPMDRPFPVPSGTDPTVRFFNQVLGGADDGRAWAPQILPAQLLVIGDLAIAAVAGELTTVAGRRLRAGLLRRLSRGGVRHVVTMPYSNTYAGYITTPEEYEVQGYEGGHTLFGRWTLAGHRTLFDQVIDRLHTRPADRPSKRGPIPPRPAPDTLARWAYSP